MESKEFVRMLLLDGFYVLLRFGRARSNRKWHERAHGQPPPAGERRAVVTGGCRR
jgi:hypothetical protein